MGPVLRAALFVGVCATALAACSDGGDEGDTTATTPPDGAATSTVGPPDASRTGQGVQPDGFTTITARITDADGEVCEVCVWLADTVEERGRGLMGVTDLGDAEGMVFRFDEPVANSFFMLNTPTPLSIAWFAPSGEYATSTDMEPCLEVPEDGCPLYAPGVQYELALEVFQGDLAGLGVGPGARLELLDGTEADRCPAGP
jgi:uncharacterized protein